eukprot:6333093-Amphidinium_carterae.1
MCLEKIRQSRAVIVMGRCELTDAVSSLAKKVVQEVCQIRGVRPVVRTRFMTSASSCIALVGSWASSFALQEPGPGAVCFFALLQRRERMLAVNGTICMGSV